MKTNTHTSAQNLKTSGMKKAALLFVLVFAMGTFLSVNAQDAKPTPENRTLSNGFSIKAQYGIPSEEFGTYRAVGSDKYGITVGLQIGNQWYISPMEKLGFGIMVNWFDYSVAAKAIDDGARATFDISLLEIGPIGTYAINNEMAIDLYYNLRPTAIINIETWESSYGGHSNQYSDTREGVGVTHAIGAGFRWRALSVGMESVFGSVNDTSDLLSADETLKMRANCFRFLIGAKF
jgi:hypothetical protein